MKSKTAVALVLGVVLTSWAAMATAQQAESQLRLISEAHIKPAFAPQYEAAIRETVALRTEHDFPFPVRMYVTEGLVYRQVIDLDDWDDMITNDAWYDQFSSPPAFVKRLNEAIDHVDTSFQRTRPELYTIPENPRFQLAEAGLIHEVRLYLKPGISEAAQVADILKRFTALYKRHGIQDGRIVWSQNRGSNGPLFAAYFPALDAADYYMHRQQYLEQMGDEYQALVRKLGAFGRGIEHINWTIRRDLSYVPGS